MSVGCLSTVSATKVAAFFQNIEAYGVNRSQVLEKARVNPDLLKLPDHRISSSEMKRILKEAVRLTGNENIGLLQGEQLTRGFSNIVGYVLLNCATLKEAAEKYCKYEKTVDGTSITETRESGDTFRLCSAMIDGELAGLRQYSDFRVAGILAYTKLLCGKRLIPVEVHFSYPRPTDTSLHEMLFGCPVLFGASSDTLVFRRKDMEVSILEPNPALLAEFERIARAALRGLGYGGVYSEKVTNIVLQEIRGEIPTVESIACKLSMSVRSLQNCLKREGTSYIRIVGEIRKEIAITYLKEKQVPTDEIAYLLGFSESSAFHRAFKRWTKTTPGEFRNLSAI